MFLGAVRVINPNAEVLNTKGSAPGPKGTMKMLVGGSGDIKLTKDANSKRDCDHVDDITTSTVILVGELMRQSERYIGEGMHPRLLVDGFDIATLEFLESFKTPVAIGESPDKEILTMLARTALRIKVHEALADQLTDIVVGPLHQESQGAPGSFHGGDNAYEALVRYGYSPG